MRFVYMLLFITLVGCNNPPHAGEEGYVCRSFPSPSCDPGLLCVDSTCVQCGDLDEPCCSDPSGTFCNPGVAACEDAPDSTGTCTGSCGANGLICCPGADPCPVSGTCNADGKCMAEPSERCLTQESGDTTHVLWIVDSLCAAVPVELHTQTTQEAEACRQTFFGVAAWGDEICPLDTTPTFSHVCKAGEPFGGMYLNHCSAAQLSMCESNWDATATWGACP